jgi:hypothetical protein
MGLDGGKPLFSAFSASRDLDIVRNMSDLGSFEKDGRLVCSPRFILSGVWAKYNGGSVPRSACGMARISCSCCCRRNSSSAFLVASSVKNASVSQYAHASDSNWIHLFFSARDGVENRNNGTMLSVDDNVDDDDPDDLLTEVVPYDVSDEVSGRWYIENTKK